MKEALLLTNGLLVHSDAKTAHGLIRGTERFTVMGVIDDAPFLHRNEPVIHLLTAMTPSYVSIIL